MLFCDLRLAIWGVETDARVEKVIPVFDRYNRPTGQLKVWYWFVGEDGKRHRAADEVDAEVWRDRKPGPMRIAYLPDDPSTTRIAGATHLWLWLALSLGLLMVIGALFPALREAFRQKREAARKVPRRPGRIS
jgi:hypothetical protein